MRSATARLERYYRPTDSEPGRPLTPRQVAQLLVVDTRTVLHWIGRHQLIAADISARAGRPCYRIYRDDLRDFLRGRGMSAARFLTVWAGAFPECPLTPEQIALPLLVDSRTVRRWITVKGLEAVNVGARDRRPSYRVYHDDLRPFLLAHGWRAERIRELLPPHWF
ncbi:MAG: helix-turn-helix domain-containing protein [Dehalococcoidia bacterium]|nr:helix-turn-helix domain-containing protein [Dehalococcoidia bacterium]